MMSLAKPKLTYPIHAPACMIAIHREESATGSPRPPLAAGKAKYAGIQVKSPHPAKRAALFIDSVGKTTPRCDRWVDRARASGDELGQSGCSSDASAWACRGLVE